LGSKGPFEGELINVRVGYKETVGIPQGEGEFLRSSSTCCSEKRDVLGEAQWMCVEEHTHRIHTFSSNKQAGIRVIFLRLKVFRHRRRARNSVHNYVFESGFIE
jgi:hypothetical protein